MADKLKSPPSPFRPYNGRAKPLPEWQILRPIWRNLPVLLFVSMMAGLLSHAYFDRKEPIFPVRAELIVRFGYEYTPVTTAGGSDQQQINSRFDEVIGSEIQFLTSLPLIALALEKAPYPASTLAETKNASTGPSVQVVSNKLGVERIEGSTVLVLTVLDTNKDWAQSFLSALIPLYFEERRRLFAKDAYEEVLGNERISLSQDLERAQTRSDMLAAQLAEALSVWEAGLGKLSADPIRSNELIALETKFSALLVRLSGQKSTAAAAEQLARYGIARTAPAVTYPTVPSVALDLGGLDDALNRIESTVEEMARIAAGQAELDERRVSLAELMMRQKIRAAESDGIVVLTPPYTADKQAGLTPVPKSILAGVVAFLLGAMLAVIVAGKRA